MKRVLVIITNPQQASYRLRIAALQPGLRQRGIELDPQIWPKSWLERLAFWRRVEGFDAVILQRKLLGRGNAATLRRMARRLFYDIDDAVMFQNRPLGYFVRRRTQRRFEATAKVVNQVVAGNEYLADMFRSRGQAVTVLPTCVDPADYRVKRRQQGGPVSLVWIGSHSTLPYLREQIPAIDSAGVKLITIADATIENAKVPVEHIAWSADTEAAALVRGDIGIAPTPDDRWTRGKCGFKIVQYMAAGLPVIASPVGANSEIVQPETGLLASTPQQWTDAIRQLAVDIELRHRMGRAGRQRVEQHYSLSRAVNAWAQLLSD